MYYVHIYSICAIWFTCVLGMTKNDAMAYLSHYGYMTGTDESNFHNCLKKFQRVAHVPMTGEMDAMTTKMMEMPRCGCSDKTTIRVKRYSIQGSKWRINDIKYNVQYPPKMTFGLVHKAVSRAFKEWGKHCSIGFLETNPHEALLHISFGPMKRNEIIGMAAYPIFGGNITFNKNTNWTNSTDSGVNLYQVALHEIGHSLGLGHSMVKNSIMYPFYDDSKLLLDEDDIDGVKTLYES